MTQNLIGELASKASCSLELARKIVGVKFLSSPNEFECADAEPLDNRMPYCVLVRLASMGYSRKAHLDNFGCLAAARAFGMVPPSEEWLSGCQYCDRGMYRDVEIAKKVVTNTTNLELNPYGVIVKPLEDYSSEPDIVIVVSSPYNVMRLIQGYTYTYGTYKSFKIIGNQAFCSECTAYPLDSGDINISVLCAGTRYMAGWGKDEMALGIPFTKFRGMIDGLYGTINPMEPNADKATIEANLNKAGRKDIEIEYDKNYYTGLYRK